MTEINSRRTPYNDTYETCERTFAEFVIYSGEMPPELVTRRLGLQPTKMQSAGEKIRNSLGRERTVPINGWFLSSEGKNSSIDLRRHLDWLLQKLLPVRDALLDLQTVRGMKMGVNCIWWSATGQGGPTLWPEQMRGMAELNLECSFDIGFYANGDE